MKILFLHGWQSTPGSRKPTFLSDQGHHLLNPPLDHDDFDAAVRRAQQEYDDHQPDVVVGSSRGGAVAINIDSHDTPQVLLCPAWKTWGTATTTKPNTTILHSRADDVVPFEHSVELVANSHLPESTLAEVGRDHRLADLEPLEAMAAAIRVGTSAPMSLIGCDFGAPARAGDQAKKIILIEAIKVAHRHYAVTDQGRNARLVRDYARNHNRHHDGGCNQHQGREEWWQRRPGWTLPGLAASLSIDPTVCVAAFDFPFSIPLSLLRDRTFADRMGQPPFESREAFGRYVAEQLPLTFTNSLANAKLRGLKQFERWKDNAFWKQRTTDRAAGGSPPLKHLYQNLFSMTLAGTALLRQLAASGYGEILGAATMPGKRCVFEAYPNKTAAQIGFQASYKNQPEACFQQARAYLKSQKIQLDMNESIADFCMTYRSQGSDPDGADAFLCLVSALAFHEGLFERCAGDADEATLREEGCIIVPQRIANTPCPN